MFARLSEDGRHMRDPVSKSLARSKFIATGAPASRRHLFLEARAGETPALRSALRPPLRPAGAPEDEGDLVGVEGVALAAGRADAVTGLFVDAQQDRIGIARGL